MAIQLTHDQEVLLETQARRRGYADLTHYVLALAQADILVATLGDELIDEDGVDHADDLRQAWHDAMTGRVQPLSNLWDALDVRPDELRKLVENADKSGNDE